jgi:hypothetical protein
VTDDETHARRAAEALLLSGQAATAQIERATLALGTGNMTFGYESTGHTWSARYDDGDVIWRPALRTLTAS